MTALAVLLVLYLAAAVRHVALDIRDDRRAVRQSVGTSRAYLIAVGLGEVTPSGSLTADQAARIVGNY